jgi:LacI family transcriptional regulator
MSKYHRPGVTTVHQDMEKKGIVAAETLIRLLKGMEVEKSMNQLPTRLVIRDTVKDLRKTL